jgi:hypothetical protein
LRRALKIFCPAGAVADRPAKVCASAVKTCGANTKSIIETKTSVFFIEVTPFRISFTVTGKCLTDDFFILIDHGFVNNRALSSGEQGYSTINM